MDIYGEVNHLIGLLSCVIGHGHTSSSAFAASNRLLNYFGSTRELAQASIEEIKRAGKISEKQARLLYYSLVLGRITYSAPVRPGERFSNSREIYHRFCTRFQGANREHFLSLHLNSKNQLIREVLISIGSLNSSIVHPREVFAPAVRDNSAALICIHNHPSGDPTPSREDKECTLRLIDAGRILGIRVLDHIILGHDDYYSFADAGLMIDECRVAVSN